PPKGPTEVCWATFRELKRPRTFMTCARSIAPAAPSSLCAPISTLVTSCRWMSSQRSMSTSPRIWSKPSRRYSSEQVGDPEPVEIVSVVLRYDNEYDATARGAWRRSRLDFRDRPGVHRMWISAVSAESDG